MLGAVVALLVAGVVGWLVSRSTAVVDAGLDAQQEEHIKRIVASELELDNGKSIAELLGEVRDLQIQEAATAKTWREGATEAHRETADDIRALNASLTEILQE